MAKRKQPTYKRLMDVKGNRQQRKELGRRLQAEDPGLSIVHQQVAGIDIGNESHFVAVAPMVDKEPVREFGSWTADLLSMAAWLKSRGVKQVVMQSTGVYWIAAYEVLEKEGFEVCLANARETKNLPGRKSDVQECQWLRKLHTYGLLRNSFRPPEQIRKIRTIWRLRDRHVKEASREVQHMQKALTTMNVQIANVISDVSGVTGQAIIRAILKGERNPHKLAALKDYRIRAGEEAIALSLEGYWKEDVLFELQQAVDRYDFIQKQIGDCDEKLERYAGKLPDRRGAGEAEANGSEGAAQRASGEAKAAEEKRPMRKKKRKTPRDNEPKFDLQAELNRICGVDLSSIDGVSVMTITTLISELGPDMTPWPTEHHLVSWLKLSPNPQFSGGKLIRHEWQKSTNRAADALRMAASTLQHSDSYLGARFRQLKGRLGPRKAIKAMAACLARLIYRMLKHGKAWIDRGAQEHEARRVERETRQLQRKAAAMGYRLEPAA